MNISPKESPSGRWLLDGGAKRMAAAGNLELARTVRALIVARRTRSRIFGPSLFADPAWDMLLELFARYLEQRRVSISHLCVAEVPQTTLLRWCARLEGEDLVCRHPDPTDARRVWIELTDKAVEAMSAYFEELPFTRE